MRLYANNDAGNILWEWAFETLALDTRIAGYDDQTEETWYVTADDPTVPFQAMIVGYAGRDASTKTPQTVKWEVKGLGSMSPASSTDKDLGVFASDLTMPTVAGAKGAVRQAYHVRYRSSIARNLDTQNAMMVGDKAAAGTLNYNRFDGVSIGMDYQISDSIRALGTKGEAVTISLGDLQDPNPPQTHSNEQNVIVANHFVSCYLVVFLF